MAEDIVKKSLKLATNNHPDSQKLLGAIDYYHSGRNAMNNKQFNKAITEFRESIHLEPFFINAYYELGRLHLRLSNLQEAKDVVEEALKLADDYPPIQRLSDAIELYNAGLNFLNGRQYNDAIDKFKETVDREPTFTEAHYSLGCAYFQSEAFESAGRSAKDTLELNTDHQSARALLDDIKKAYYTQGLDCITYGMYADAIELLQKACALDPNDQEVWANLGRAYYLTDEYVNAANCYQKVTNLDPKDKNAYSNLGNAYFRIGKYANAIAPLQKACALDPNCGKFYYYLGCTQFKLDRLGEAKWAAEKALEIDQAHHPSNKLLKKIEKRSHEIIRMDNPDMILIPAGEFQMGCGDQSTPSNEKPIHTVYLDDFYIDKYPVTNAQYKEFIDANPQWRKDHIPRKYHNGNYLKHWKGNNYPSGTANHPVVYVNWYAAMAYAQWAGKRLPTATEWKKAARGDHDLPDMCSNIWEWCIKTSDLRAINLTTDSTPTLEFINVKNSRLLCGDSYQRRLKGQLPDHNKRLPKFTSEFLGFRCVKPIIT